MKVAIVAPVHIQPSEEWTAALWEEARAADAHVIIVDDSDGKVELPWAHDAAGDMYDYAKQREALGDELYAQFEQFHHSAACKQFGLWKAWKDGYDVVIVIDSDCVVSAGFVQGHLDALAQKGNGWGNPLANAGLYSRGFPYSLRALPKWAHMGLWTKELDLYGTDRVAYVGKLPTSPSLKGVLSTSAHFPQSGMNISFVAAAIPFMLFLPNFRFRDKTFTRHDDIWGGYIFQKIARAKRGSLSLGEPFVEHDTIVDAKEDAEAEAPMVLYEDRFFEMIDDSLVFSGDGCKLLSAPEIFAWLARETTRVPVFAALAPAFEFWANALE